MGIYKRISNVIGIYISVCFFLSCSGNTDLKRENAELINRNKELQSRYEEMASDKQAFVEKSRKQSQTISDITSKLAVISKEMPTMRYNAERGYLKMSQVEQINDYLFAIDKELQKARSGELDNEQLAIVKNLQSIVKLQQGEITVLRTANNAWVAFNAASNVRDYEKAYSQFLLSDESTKREGSRAFLNKALQLIAARNGECDNTAKTFLLRAKELNNTQEIRDLINKCK